MYYRLKDPYLLRGWERLPFAVKNSKTGQVHFFDKETYLILIKCDGTTNLDLERLSSDKKKILKELSDQGLIESFRYRNPIGRYQEYVKYPARFIQSVHWSMTGNCNYKCRHCFMSASSNKLGELSTKACLKIIDNLIECGITNVSLTGGEPLIRKDFFELLDYMIENGFIIDSIYSNGRLITEDFLKNLIERNIKPAITLSFDGVGFHDWLRGIDGAETSVINALKLCQKYGFKTNAAMCLHRMNKDSIHKTVLLLKELGVSGLKISRISSMGEWENEPEELKLSLAETYEVYLDYLSEYYKAGLPIPIQMENFFASLNTPTRYAIPGEKFSGKDNCLNKAVCGHVRKNLYIDPEGYVLPCMPMANTSIVEDFPNILKTSLAEILNDSYYMDCINVKVKDLLEHNSQCRECQYILKCGGGCRGLALGEFSKDSNYYQVDPSSCFFFKNHYPEKIGRTVDRLIEEYFGENKKILPLG